MTAGGDGALPPVAATVVRARRRRGGDVSVAVGLFVVVLLSLQIFLLTVGVDALLADDDGLAWITAGFSVLLAAGSVAFYRYLR
jgi:hypothetical protein